MASNRQILIPNDFTNEEGLSNFRKKYEGGHSRSIEFDGIKARVFNVNLWLFFVAPGLAYYESGEEVSRNDLFKAFVGGFARGKEKFKEAYSVPPEILFGNPKPYIQTLQEACFHKDPISGLDERAWAWKVRQFPLFYTTLEEIEKLGLYAGLYSSVLEMQRLYPKAFSTFEKCHLKGKDLTKFENAVWYELLRRAGLKDNLTASDKKNFGGKNFELRYNDYTSKRRVPNEKECENIIEALSEYPSVKKAAINHFDENGTL
jgi:hypothetical protein